MPLTVDGFLVERRELPTPLIAPDEELRDRLIWQLAAVMAWRTPEEIAAALESGKWTDDVARLVANDRDELAAHVDMLLAAVGE